MGVYMLFAAVISASRAVRTNVDIPFDGNAGWTYKHQVVYRQLECVMADAAYTAYRSPSFISHVQQPYSHPKYLTFLSTINDGVTVTALLPLITRDLLTDVDTRNFGLLV
jgi:hypothetical protein